ncbi:alpha-ketoacid dehydrogenase kinase [Neolentinus lepideus HHB14362 ss-1]|uniref:Protein-serine/threonine kinase n=1 Tax=Neolentinus lepideus HHB14362 ss-1 TaxID=1314782 RepID=A0A165T9I3_9AGAM|nr:alpha-ketoacid dehydrogenase kinase [Neolentinus lepideus HHB14362 ss-1]
MSSTLFRCKPVYAFARQRRPFVLHRRPPDPVPSGLAELLEKHSHRPPTPLTLSTLLSLGRPPTPKSVLTSVSYVQAEIPRRLAQRVKSLQELPFIVGTNPFVARILEAHRTSFLWLATQPSVRTLEDNADFISQLETLVQSHANDIPTLARGFQECTRYMSSTQISNFLDGAIRNRIAVRLLAEQHIALSRALNSSEEVMDRIGVVELACSPAHTIKMCGAWVSELCEATLGASPEITLDGDVDATFVYVPVHLEYIATEILKNSFRATVEHHYKHHGMSSRGPIPPVIITVCPSRKLDGRSHIGLRIRDQGGGVSPANMARIFSYAFTTADRSTGREEIGGGPYAAQHVGGGAAVGVGSVGEGNLFEEMTGKGLQVGMGTIAGLGYGLPMSRLYARYFDGSLNLLSLDGWGSDVFVQLRCLDEAGEMEV